MAMETAGHGQRPAAGRFPSLAVEPGRRLPRAGRRATGVIASVVVHAALVAAVIVLPLLVYRGLPGPEHQVRAFLAEPLTLAPPPPPPPPPPARPRRVIPPRRPHPPRVDTAKLVAPVEMPKVLPVPEESLDLGVGVDGGVPGGVAGGVPGGVVGGMVAALPSPPPPPPKVVRVGGAITAPELLRRVAPVYPEIARQARVQGIVILEAHVDTRGRVTAVKVLRGQPLLDEPATIAVRQCRTSRVCR
jgi:protein TonB